MAKNIPNSKLDEELLKHAKDGEQNKVKKAVKGGAYVNCQDTVGESPLHKACLVHGNITIVKLLIDKGANLNAQDKDGWAPLHWACSNGHIEVVKLLINKGASVNVVNKGGYTPLHCTCRGGYLDVVRFLIENGADLNAQILFEDGKTPIHLASHYGHIEVVRLLVDKGVYVDTVTKNEWTPLHFACFNGDITVVKFLLQIGANENSLNQEGKTPVDLAKIRNKLDVVKYITEGGEEGLKPSHKKLASVVTAVSPKSRREVQEEELKPSLKKLASVVTASPKSEREAKHRFTKEEELKPSQPHPKSASPKPKREVKHRYTKTSGKTSKIPTPIISSSMDSNSEDDPNSEDDLNSEDDYEDHMAVIANLQELNCDTADSKFLDDVLAAAAKLFVKKAEKLEGQCELEQAIVYYNVAIYEGKLLGETVVANLRKKVENLNCASAEKMQNLVQQRITEVGVEIDDVQLYYDELSNKVSAEALLLEKQKDDLEKERKELGAKAQKLTEKEGLLQRQAQEFEEQYKQWQLKVEEEKQRIDKLSQSHNEGFHRENSVQLLNSVNEASEDVRKKKEDMVIRLERAESARNRLCESEKALRERVEKLDKYLSIVEQQGMLPERKYYVDLLKSVKRIVRHKSHKLTCFISYAWNPDKQANAALQKQLQRLKEDLTIAGASVLLDIEDMDGNISNYMMSNIAGCDRVLLICTPRLVERASQLVVGNKPNNLQIEMAEALEKQKQFPKFLVPIIFEGGFSTAVPEDLLDTLVLDMSKLEQYCDHMTSLKPKGLIPLLFELEQDKIYREFLCGYQAKREAIELRVSKELISISV